MKEKNYDLICYFGIFFFVIFSVNILYIVIAKKMWCGIATTNSYQKGLRYNDHILNRREQENLNWRVSVDINDIDEKSKIFLVSVKDKQLQPIKNAIISAIFKRPTKDNYDFSVLLREKNGTYLEKVSFPLPGQWEAEILIIYKQKTFQIRKRIFIKQS